MKPSTPLPWTYGDPRKRSNFGSSHSMLASQSRNIGRIGMMHTPAEAEQDAAYIVKACNSYPELVAALRAILPIADGAVDFQEEIDTAHSLLAKLGE